tara:strand:+ start:8236 stop:8487 length:252 start_codon:yes stop_codon:yes gene_type:complete
MNIIVKNSDRLKSAFHTDKVMNEYLVYLMDEDVKISVDIVYGDVAKNELIDKLLENNYESFGKYILEEIIEEVAFEDFKNQYV